MNQNKGLHLLYKNLGETPNERILRFKKDNPEYAEVSMTYAGRLDPMAEGLLLVVSGDEIKEKQKYQNLNKAYEVQVLWGFETDTLDVLGVVSENSFSAQFFWSNLSRRARLANFSSFKKIINGVPLLFSKLLRKAPKELVASTNFPSLKYLQMELEEVNGKFEQKYPAYSSKPVNGKPLFQWAREGRIGEVIIPSHIVEIYEMNFVARRTISKEELLVNIKFKIESMRGDFRQKEIWEKWLNELTQLDSSKFIIDTLRMSVSSGFYVRQFVKDLAEQLGTVATTFHIVRGSVGEYRVADSIK
ncbi:MAG: hypothetical protein EXS47_00380 [Candidatus Zambryskibacteria bacterium]|nr:hypothetical protein [Candidatus Zambryskibacteria bacterium]